MQMRLGGSGYAGASQNSAIGNWQQRQQSFRDLFSALQTGDLGGAQEAISGVTSNGGTVSGNSPLARIAQALKGGDIGSAQQAAQALQAARIGLVGQFRADPSTVTASPTAVASAAPGIGSLIDTTR